MKTVIMDITPEEAKRMLGHNLMNRKLNEHTCRTYADDMRSGRWYSNGVPIVIDYDGNLRDGQHRLTAIVKSGITMRDALVIYTDKENAVCYDIGKPRTVRDTATLMGLTSSNVKNNSIISMITFMLRRLKGQHGIIPKTLIIETIEENEDLCDFIRLNYIAKKMPNLRGLKNVGIIAAIGAAYLNGFSHEQLLHICDVIASGIISDDNDIGIIKVRDYVISSKFCTGKDYALEVYFHMQRAMKNHEKGIITKQLGKKREEYYKIPTDIIPEKYRE